MSYEERGQWVYLAATTIAYGVYLVLLLGGATLLAALNLAGVADDFSYVSRAGGAFLEWMVGMVLPERSLHEENLLRLWAAMGGELAPDPLGLFAGSINLAGNTTRFRYDGLDRPLKNWRTVAPEQDGNASVKLASLISPKRSGVKNAAGGPHQ